MPISADRAVAAGVATQKDHPAVTVRIAAQYAPIP